MGKHASGKERYKNLEIFRLSPFVSATIDYTYVDTALYASKAIRRYIKEEPKKFAGIKVRKKGRTVILEKEL